MSNKDFENNGNDFEFDLPDWEKNEAKPASAGASKSEEGFSTDFGAATFDDDKGGDEDFSDFGGFGAMPTQASMDAVASRGNPDTEFGDFGADVDHGADHDAEPEFGAVEETNTFDAFEQTFARADAPQDFGQYDTDPLSGQATDFEDVQDAMDNGLYMHSETSDPYAEVPEEQAYQPPAAEKSAGKPLLSKLILPIGVAAVLGIGGFVGYNMLMSSTAPVPVVVADTQPKAADFPHGLPPVDTAQANLPAAATPAADTPAKPVFGQDVANDDGELTINLPGQVVADAKPVEAVHPTPVTPAPTSPVVDQPVLVPPTAEGGIPKTATVADAISDITPPPAVDTSKFVARDEFDALVARIDSMQEDVAAVRKLAESFDHQVAAPSAPAQALPGVTPSVDAGEDVGLNPNAKPVASFDSVIPPLKPIIVNGVVLKGVSRDVAWIKVGDAQTIEARVGDELPKGGKVVAIRNYRGDWVIVTSEGIIVR
jgi:hypothetical protein